MVYASRLNRTTREPSIEEPGERLEDKWDPGKPHALSSLTELSLCLDQGAYQDFEEVARWAFLPSLRSFRGRGLHGSLERFLILADMAFHYAMPGHQSEITTLELEECMLYRADFEILLRSIKALRTFKYHFGIPESFEYSSPAPEDPWDPCEIVEILSTYASHSLVILDLTRSNFPENPSENRLSIQYFVGSLRRFHLLRKLRADIMIFVELNLGDLTKKHEHMHREESVEQRAERTTRLGTSLTAQARPLVRLLPAALEDLSLCLTHKAGKWESEDLFKEARQLKAQKLPNLTKIVIEGEREPFLISDKTIQIWKNCGVQIYRQVPFTVS